MISGRSCYQMALAIGLILGANGTALAASKATKQFSPNPSLRVCSGYSCALKEKFTLTSKQQTQLNAIMSAGSKSAVAERKAVAKAIAAMEKYARGKLRYSPDKPKASPRYNGYRGQMDCVDESLNTTAYLTYLYGRGWLRHHKPRRAYAERGLFFDGRYPHKSAVMIENTGRKWTVDSWYKSDGHPPIVKPLSQWVRES